jgi:hypothetical protein
MTRSSNSVVVGTPMRPLRSFMLALVALFAIGLTFAWTGAPPDTAHAATLAISQCNGEETGAAREIRCDVSVVNNIDIATGVTSSTVTTTVCVGPPGEALSNCVTTPTASTDIVGSVNQCNNSVNAGGSTVVCNVSIVNNVTGIGSTSPATVNQCVGSGQGGGTEPTTDCDPVSSASGADIIQCNTAGNGGGASERVTCTVLTSTVSSLWPVTVVQCNDSANGGGDLVTCTSQITTNIFEPSNGGGDTTTTEGDGGGTTTTEGNGDGGGTTTTEGNGDGGGTTTTEGNGDGGGTTTTEGNGGGGGTTTTDGNGGAGTTTIGGATTTVAVGGATTSTTAAPGSELPDTGGFSRFAPAVGLLAIGVGMMFVLVAARRNPSATEQV